MSAHPLYSQTLIILYSVRTPCAHTIVMSGWEELRLEGEDMDELARAAAGVVGPHTLSPYPMYVPTGDATIPTGPATGIFPKADVQATVEATQGDVKKKPRGDPERFKKNREKKRRMLHFVALLQNPNIWQSDWILFAPPSGEAYPTISIGLILWC